MNNEKNLDIQLFVVGGKVGVRIDVCHYPIFCPTCKNYFPELYNSKGSRYGYVGFEYCTCGERVDLSDSDNIVDYVECSCSNASGSNTVIIDFKEEFQLRIEDFEIIKRKLNYDIFDKHHLEKIYLSEIIEEIKKERNVKKIMPIESKKPLPPVVKEWIELLNHVAKKADRR